MQGFYLYTKSAGIFLGALMIFSLTSTANAYLIEDIDVSPNNNDFVLGPGKTELLLDPGETTSRELLISNRLGKPMSFEVSIEDFAGGDDPKDPVVLLGDKRGPYSLKDYLKPEMLSFTLESGKRMVLPVKIVIPKNAEPGNLLGAVLIRTNPPENQLEIEKDKAKGQVRIESQLGTLVFVRVSGPVKEEGQVTEVKTPQRFYSGGNIPLQVFYKNTGDVYVVPYGVAEIKNMLGSVVGEVVIDPWFALPKATRFREVKWESGMVRLGRYTVDFKINRGYGDIVDEKSLTLWVIPWKLALLVFVAIFILALLIRFLHKHIKLRVT